MANKVGLFNFRKKEPLIHTYKNPKTQIRLAYNDYTNTSYEVVVDDVKEVKQGETFQELLRRNFSIDSIKNNESGNYFGFGKKLEPKTKSIIAMKETIDLANKRLVDFNAQQKALIDNMKKEYKELKNEQKAQENKEVPNV